MPGAWRVYSTSAAVIDVPPRPAPLRQVELTRYLKAVKAAGVEVRKIEIDPGSGKVVVVTDKAGPDEAPNDWDRK